MTSLLVLNHQPVEKADYHDDGSLEIVDVWFTIQGEGPFAGEPAVFIRLAGCNLDCPACFHGETAIRMSDFSQKPIGEVVAGDTVLSYDENVGVFTSQKVASTMQRTATQVYRVSTGAKKTFVTEEHPFLVRGKGWVQAKSLSIGDAILHLDVSTKMRLKTPMKTNEHKQKMLETMVRRKAADPTFGKMSAESRIKIGQVSRARMLSNNPMKNPATAIKGFLARKDRGKMSAAEKWLLQVGEGLGLKFVGDGSLVVANKCPDFMIEGTKKLVEVWDDEQTEYMGRNEEWRIERRRVLESEGYEVLFLPILPIPLGDKVGSRKKIRKEKRDAEVARVRGLLAEYAHNGCVVTGVEKITAKTHPKVWTRLTGSLVSPLFVYNLEVENTHTYLANGMVVHNCDTDYTSNRHRTSVAHILQKVSSVGRARDGDCVSSLIVITGGEPFRQNIAPLVDELIHLGYRVQIETNGTLFPSRYPIACLNLTVVCSPKTGKVNDKLKPFIHCLKYVVEAGKVDPNDGLPTDSLGAGVAVQRPWPGFGGQVFIQPLDEQDPERNKAHMAEAVNSCTKFGYRLSVQLHKLAGLA